MDLIYKNETKYTNKTIYDVLKNEFDISRNLLIKLKRENKIFCNDLEAKSKDIVKDNDVIKVNLDFVEDNENIVPTKMDLNIIYEDEYLLVLNKPCNTPVHPSHNNYTNSLSNGVKFYFDSIGLNKKIRPVNRLDKDTTGLVVFAKSEYIQEQLIKQMEKGIFEKKYLALVEGTLDKKQGTINLPIARKMPSIIERCVREEDGEKAITNFNVLKEFNNISLIEFKLETGRTHQIRVHSMAIGHPILGDTLYGNPSNLIARQALHSYFISFIHPIKKEQVQFMAPVPSDFENIINSFLQ